MRSGGEVLGCEFLRVSEVIPERLDFLGQPARLAARLEAERSEAGDVARQDVRFVLDLQAVDEQAIGVPALAFVAQEFSPLPGVPA